MKVAIAQDSTAIGYVSIGHIDNSVKAPKLGGTLPSQENAMSGSYPVTRKLYMNTKGKPSVLVQSFIDYILGESGAEIIKKSGYLPL
jgi:phosphate transport system substrate-binding protein